MRRLLLSVASGLALGFNVHAAQLSACTAGVTTCSNDTANDAAIVAAMSDPTFQARVWWLWLQNCSNVFSEAGSTAGHVQRVAFCQAVYSNTGPSAASNRVPLQMLVGAVLNATVSSEVLAGSGSPPAGNAVDADINTAIGAALTVAATTASTTATASSGSMSLTVASATGIVVGMNAFAAGLQSGAQVVNVSGTTILLSLTTTAALSSTPIVFSTFSGIGAKGW